MLTQTEQQRYAELNDKVDLTPEELEEYEYLSGKNCTRDADAEAVNLND